VTSPPNAEGSKNASTFEDAYRELQRVIAQLDDGGLALEDAVRLFERGQELVKRCQRIVDEAELRVTRLAAEPTQAAPVNEA
jgi:exodeoxyribonuclease VII small subunit